jgi:uncharacterized protein YydD (DUF2326 family)
MIHAVRADKPSFKQVRFQSGFNVVLADRTKDSTKKDTRNGLGKTSLLSVIHFCLGGKIDLLAAEALRDWTFELELDLKGQRVTVARNTARPRTVQISADTEIWPIQPKINRTTGHPEYRISDWNALLGVLMFGLPEEMEGSFNPTFRSAISYFIRLGACRETHLHP